MRSWALLAGLALCVLLLLPAPADAQLVPGTSAGRNLNYGGRLRSYRVFLPAGVKANAPILVGLHGGGLGTAQQFEKGSGFSGFASQHGFVAIYPQGVLNTWNAGECCGAAVTQKIDDAGFIAAVIADVRTRDALQGGPVYATGMSNGGMMAYRLGCERPDLFSGIAAVAATISLPTCKPALPTHLLHIHGLQDENVPYNGGFPSKGFSQKLKHRSVPSSIQVWTTANHCLGPHPKTARSERPGQMETAASGCLHQVRLVTLKTAGHTWPGDTGAVADANNGAVMDASYPNYDASARIVDFFGLSN